MHHVRATGMVGNGSVDQAKHINGSEREDKQGRAR